MAYKQPNNPFLKKSPARQERKLQKLNPQVKLGDPPSEHLKIPYTRDQSIEHTFGVVPDLISKVTGKHPQDAKKHLKEYEEKVSDFLGNPMERAGQYASKHAWKLEYGPQLEEQDVVRSIEAKQAKQDQIRHALAGAYTADKVGIIGANILGIAHEMISPNTPEEHKSDLINNAIGSVVGGLVPDSKVEKTIEWLSARGWLHTYEKNK